MLVLHFRGLDHFSSHLIHIQIRLRRGHQHFLLLLVLLMFQWTRMLICIIILTVLALRRHLMQHGRQLRRAYIELLHLSRSGQVIIFIVAVDVKCRLRVRGHSLLVFLLYIGFLPHGFHSVILNDLFGDYFLLFLRLFEHLPDLFDFCRLLSFLLQHLKQPLASLFIRVFNHHKHVQ